MERKRTPEMATQEVRQQLNWNYYVTPQLQVKNLYFLFNSLFCNGKK